MDVDAERQGGFYRLVGTDIEIRLKVVPGAARDAVGGVEAGPDGLYRLRIRVRAVPEKGAANAAVLKCLARALGMPKSELVLHAGAGSRLKTVRTPASEGLCRTLCALCAPDGPALDPAPRARIRRAAPKWR